MNYNHLLNPGIADVEQATSELSLTVRAFQLSIEKLFPYPGSASGDDHE
jgi:hypothetical protein